MTAQLLASELGNLIQDAKRKNSELRNAAEKSLQDLKALPVTSEAQLAADLSRRPHFISPFLVACSTHNAKFSSTGVSCLQRLGVSRALPRERLAEVLDALKESVSSSHDVQLKILQALPSLLQNYSSDIRGELLSITLQICSALQGAKNPAVSNTAAATFQQLVIAVFDRVASEDERALEIPTITEVTADSSKVAVRPAAHDAYKVFNDLNLLVTGEKPTFVRLSSLPSTSILEVIEAILSNHRKIMSTHPEQIHILRSLLMPMIIRSLSDRHSFPITVRIFRILNLLVRNHLRIMPSECEIALGLLNYMLDPEASPIWKRALCLEMFRGIYSEPQLVLDIYAQFDEQEGKKCIFGDNLAAFVRLATEKPALIGLGQHSTAPLSQKDGKDVESEQVVAEAGALAGVIAGPVSDSNPSNRPIGISLQWSSLKTPCMEHLDKVDPPALPETYVYSLVLICITSVSESLAKFILPLTVHHESKIKKKKGEDLPSADAEAASPIPSTRRLSRTQSFRKKTVPVNPLTLTDHAAHSFIQATSTLVTECWPAVLATCSTFLNAALDTEYYRALVRAIQKFTQVAGLLRLSTPRDAFLTTLAKTAVPPSLLHASVFSPKLSGGENSSTSSHAKGLLGVDGLVSQVSPMATDQGRRTSHEISVPTLGPRNLLCLRALLNLAIALGPTLQSTWSIIFETLQVADLVLAISNQQGGLRTPGTSRPRAEVDISSEKIEAETVAVQAAARRLFESTVDFPNDSFVELLQALCALLAGGSTSESGQRTPTDTKRPQLLHQRRMGSVTSISISTETNARDSMFVLNKIEELVALNEGRLSQYDPDESGWDVFVAELVRFASDVRKPAAPRLLAADILSRTAKEIAESSAASDQRDQIQTRALGALQVQITSLYDDDSSDNQSYSDTDIRIHQAALEALKSIIEQCGESLVAGWDAVFGCLLSVFASSSALIKEDGVRTDTDDEWIYNVEVISRSLARSAFGSIQLICSDFLASVPDTSLSILLDLLLRFCRQQDDLNMSLTTITFFWNVSDFLHTRSDLSLLPNLLEGSQGQDQVRRTVHVHSQKGTMPTLWLEVLMDLSAVTTDRRVELRNSAVQTIQRIFENYADQLSSQAWMLCLRAVLFAMVESNLSIHMSIRSKHVPADEVAGWNETTKTVLGSVSVLLTTYLDRIDDPSGLGGAWYDLLDYMQKYFVCGSHALGSSVFSTMTAVLSRVEDAHILGAKPLERTAAVWSNYFSYRNTWQKAPEDNQDAFIAYAEAFRSIYRLSRQMLAPNLPSMLSNLEACIIESDQVAYSSDIDHMTQLQTQAMDCFSAVDSSSEGLPSFLVQLLSRLTVLPYTPSAANPDRKGPTFVALSKVAMGLLQTTIIKHVMVDDLYTSGAFHFALQSLAKPIQEKYVWQREGKAPTLWKKATSTNLIIIEPSLPYLRSAHLKDEIVRDIWTQIVTIGGAIIRADISSLDPPASTETDEQFDIASFSSLRKLITTALGSPTLPDSLRRTYTRNLFETSIIHKPTPGEIPNLVSAPLENLYKIRYGQTNDPGSILREDMAFVCFAELVSLVSAYHEDDDGDDQGSGESSSAHRIKLAQAAAPYLILRAALPLRAYIADHPLRGFMPAPASQRKELLFTLQKLADLQSAPHAIPDAPGVTSTHRKHVHRLYPLLVKAGRVARGDAEVYGRVEVLMQIVGDEFGLLDG